MKHQPVKQGQTTTPRTPCPTLCEKCVGSLTSLLTRRRGLLFTVLIEKTRKSNHLQMSLQRQHILLSYFKTLSVSPVLGFKPRPPPRQSGALPIKLTGRLSEIVFKTRRRSKPCAYAFVKASRCHCLMSLLRITII